MSTHPSQQPTAEQIQQQLDIQEFQQNQQTASQLASGIAQSKGGPVGEDDANMARFLTKIDLDMDEDDELGKALATEMSQHFMTGNLSPQQYEREYWHTDIETDLIAMEFRDEKTALDDKDMQNMYPEYDTAGNPAPKPVMTDTLARRLNSAGRVKQIALSKSKHAELLRRLTEIHTVAKTEKTDTGSGGWREKLGGWI